MVQKYSPEQVWKLIDKLPKELEDAFFSAEIAKHIREICKRNEVVDKISVIAEQIGYVLLGLLPIEEFKEYLEQELGKETAKRVSHEINRFIFFPVKQSLAELYKEPTEAGAAPAKPTETKPGPKTPSAPEKEDIYRETVE
ncbi:hypothetical protein KJ636_02120 [Patescibacteria group bacterium]|nr:hypothetical protein [Patescibacteria group bacterium]MBU4480792.1 hypothetical protein [Patescibacteria group bacterium]